MLQDRSQGSFPDAGHLSARAKPSKPELCEPHSSGFFDCVVCTSRAGHFWQLARNCKIRRSDFHTGRAEILQSRKSLCKQFTSIFPAHGRSGRRTAVQYRRSKGKHKKEKRTGKIRPGYGYGGKHYEKDHAPFVPCCLWCRSRRCCPDRLRRFRFFHCGFFRRCIHGLFGRFHCFRQPVRQCGHRRFHFHEERHRRPDRRFR